MAAEGDLQRMVQGGLDKRAEWAAQQPSLGAELKAMAREAAKDIREVLIDQAYFGKPGGHGEPGAPLNPTPQMVTQDLGTVQGAYNKMLDSYSHAAGVEQGRDQDRGLER